MPKCLIYTSNLGVKLSRQSLRIKLERVQRQRLEDSHIEVLLRVRCNHVDAYGTLSA